MVFAILHIPKAKVRSKAAVEERFLNISWGMPHEIITSAAKLRRGLLGVVKRGIC